MTHQPIALRTNHDDRFRRAGRASTVRELRELPSGTIVKLRTMTYHRTPEGAWDNGFRALTTAELASAIGREDYLIKPCD